MAEPRRYSLNRANTITSVSEVRSRYSHGSGVYLRDPFQSNDRASPRPRSSSNHSWFSSPQESRPNSRTSYRDHLYINHPHLYANLPSGASSSSIVDNPSPPRTPRRSLSFQRSPSRNSHFLSNSFVDNRNGTIQVNAPLSPTTSALSIFDLLHPYICSRAMFDGDDRDDAPKCHPETRKSILGDIEPWAISRNSEGGILWLKGPVGTGKSAIARKVCEDLHKQDPRLLIGSFFFWRNDSGRNSVKTFVATIAYRLSVVMPEVGELIVHAILQNPSIMDYPLEPQWDALIIQPLRQQQLIQLLSTLSQHNLHRRVAVLVASRPESLIESEIAALIFDKPQLFQLPHLMLTETRESREDMRLILTTKFNDIRRRRHHIIGNRRWPPEDTVNRIIDLANGQFIYALTIVRWLTEEDGHPVERLGAIFGASNHQRTRAFAPLDRLYALILKTACSKESGNLVLPCLFLLTYVSLWLNQLAKPSALSRFFGQDCSYIRLMLQPLHSVLRVPEDDSSDIEIYHKSYSEFLHDQSRSGIYWTGQRRVLTQLLTQSFALDHMQLGFDFDNQDVGIVWLWLPFKAIEMTPALIHSLARTHATDWLHKYLVLHEKLQVDSRGVTTHYREFCQWLESGTLPRRRKGAILRKFPPNLFSSGPHDWMWILRTWWFDLWSHPAQLLPCNSGID
ncbi:hypothetical protein AX16_003372 [Volvariella volvacea WC 439]|nr:hypothetical protein AX16_003372 [Volvariella volvacea WC 439]